MMITALKRLPRPAAAAAAIVAAHVVLAGCASRSGGRQIVDDGTGELGAAPLCCGGSLANAKRRPLPQPSHSIDVTIDNTAQAYDFGGHKAFSRCSSCPRSRRACRSS